MATGSHRNLQLPQPWKPASINTMTASIWCNRYNQRPWWPVTTTAMLTGNNSNHLLQLWQSTCPASRHTAYTIATAIGSQDDQHQPRPWQPVPTTATSTSIDSQSSQSHHPQPQQLDRLQTVPRTLWTLTLKVRRRLYIDSSRNW